MQRFDQAVGAAHDDLARLLLARDTAAADLGRVLAPVREARQALLAGHAAASRAAAAADDAYRPHRAAERTARAAVTQARAGVAAARRDRRGLPPGSQDDRPVEKARAGLAAALAAVEAATATGTPTRGHRDLARRELGEAKNALDMFGDPVPEQVYPAGTERLDRARRELAAAALNFHAAAAGLARASLLAIEDLPDRSAAAAAAVAAAVEAVAVDPDPVRASLLAGELLPVLQQAGQDAKRHRRDRVVAMRDDGQGGYGRLAALLGLSRGRVQQIVNDVASGRPEHRDQARRRELKVHVRAGASPARAAVLAGVDPGEAERLLAGSPRGPGRPARPRD